MSSGSDSTSVPIEVSSVSQSPPGQVDPPDRALEQHVAREDRLLGGDRVGQVPGAVSGREQHVDLEPGELEPLAAAQRVVGLVALVRAEARRTARSS